MKNILFLTLLTCSLYAQNGIKGVYSVSLSVQNLEQSAAFYQKAIGFTEGSHFVINKKIKVESKSGIKHIDRKTATLQCPNGRIELIEFQGIGKQELSVMPVQGPGITHICYQSSAENSIYKQAKINGATVVSRGTTPVNRGYGIQYAYIRDANNIMFETEQFDKVPFNEAMWIGHVALVSPNMDKIIDFYTKLLGRKPQNRLDKIKSSTKLDDIANIDSLKLNAAWFKTPNMLLEIWQFDNPPTTPPQYVPSFSKIGYQKITFEVENLDSLYQSLSKTGLLFLSKPVKNKGVKEVMLCDPDGNLLSLIELPALSPLSIDKLKKL